MQKLLVLSLLALATPSFAQQSSTRSAALEDADYVNLAVDFWKDREGGWTPNEELKGLIHEVERESEKCSHAMTWVPLPIGAPLGRVPFSSTRVL